MRHEMEETILAHEMKHREKVIAVNKRATEKVASLKKAITHKDKEISDINDMAISMADEYSTLENQRKAQSRETTKLVEHHKKLATTRLEKMSTYKQQSEDHQLYIESLQQQHEQELAPVTAEVASLKHQLSQWKDNIQHLETELTEAIEEIHVSGLLPKHHFPSSSHIIDPSAFPTNRN